MYAKELQVMQWCNDDVNHTTMMYQWKYDSVAEQLVPKPVNKNLILSYFLSKWGLVSNLEYLYSFSFDRIGKVNHSPLHLRIPI